MTSHSSSTAGSGMMSDLKSGIKGIHGAGEAIRGNFNEAVDTAFNDKAGEAKNQAVASKGVREMEGAEAVADRKRKEGARSGAVGNMGGGGGMKTGGMVNEPEQGRRVERF